jgi:hypothetical protein
MEYTGIHRANEATAAPAKGDDEGGSYESSIAHHVRALVHDKRRQEAGRGRSRRIKASRRCLAMERWW